MRLARCVVALALGLTACSSAPEMASPPPGFPDLSAFTDVDPSKYDLGGPSFVSPQQISCVLDFDRQKSIVCSGNIRGIPDSVEGTGCPAARKVDKSTTDTPYVLERSGPECAPSKFVPIQPGRKLTAENGTCAAGDDGLVACIDADNKHGFVLQPSGSWTF